jgi:hypothetical protein
MGDMIRQMAFAIADAQFQLDEASIQVARYMSGEPVSVDDGNGGTTEEKTTVLFDGEELSMIELGFTPTFYQFVDTLIEVKIAIKITAEATSERKVKGTRFAFSSNRNGFSISTTPVDATYTSKYNYSAEGSSLLRTKLVPVPPPSILEERIRAAMEKKAAE